MFSGEEGDIGEAERRGLVVVSCFVVSSQANEEVGGNTQEV